MRLRGEMTQKVGFCSLGKKKNKAILLQDTDQRLKGKLYYI